MHVQGHTADVPRRNSRRWKYDEIFLYTILSVLEQYWKGGAIRFNDVADASITSSTFRNNRAAIGGAVYIKNKLLSAKLRVAIISSSAFANNSATGLGQSLYNNEDIVLRDVHFESDEINVGYHIHSECGTFEANNMTMEITRRGTNSPDSNVISNGLFVASSKIMISDGWKYICPYNLNAGMHFIRSIYLLLRENTVIFNYDMKVTGAYSVPSLHETHLS